MAASNRLRHHLAEIAALEASNGEILDKSSSQAADHAECIRKFAQHLLK